MPCLIIGDFQLFLMKALFSSILLLAVLIFGLLQPVATQVPAPVVLTADAAPAGVRPALAHDE